MVLPRSSGSLSAQQCLPLLLALLDCGDKEVQVEDLAAVPKKASGHETHSEEEEHRPSPAGTPVAYPTCSLQHLPTDSQKCAATIPCQGLCLQPCLNHAWEPLHQLHLAPHVNLLFYQNRAKLSLHKVAMTVSLVPYKRNLCCHKSLHFPKQFVQSWGLFKP